MKLICIKGHLITNLAIWRLIGIKQNPFFISHVKTGAGVGTASLPSPGADYRGQTCTLSGWGLVRRHPEQLADQLQKVRVIIDWLGWKQNWILLFSTFFLKIMIYQPFYNLNRSIIWSFQVQTSYMGMAWYKFVRVIHSGIWPNLDPFQSAVCLGQKQTPQHGRLWTTRKMVCLYGK